MSGPCLNHIRGKRISVVMPAFNESRFIVGNLREVVRVFSDFACDFEVILVDDGSGDGTYLHASRVLSEYPEHIRIIHYDVNQGKGNALMAGAACARGDYIAFLDADMDLHPSQLPTFFAIMDDSDAAAVIGSKRHPGSHVNYPAIRRLYSAGYYELVHVLFGLPLRDTQTGLKLFRAELLRDVLPRVLAKRFAFDIEILAIAHHLGYKIADAPVNLEFHRPFGRIDLRQVWKILLDTLAIFYRLRIRRYYEVHHNAATLRGTDIQEIRAENGKLVSKVPQRHHESPAGSALVCLLPGLGDALMASTIVQTLLDARYCVDALTMLEPVAEYARDLRLFNRVHHIPLLSGIENVRFLAGLRRRHYDLVVIPEPATRWQYAAVALAVGANATVTHRYGGFAGMIARIGHFTEVPLRGGHRIAENRRLAQVFGTPTQQNYLIPGSWRSPERIPGLIGIHPGSMQYRGNEAKRWPLDRFASLIKTQVQHGRSVRIFAGPQDREDAYVLASRFEKIPVVERPLPEAAYAISECSAFVANDTGLAHLAAGLDVPVVTLFGITDPKRVRPIGPSIAVRPSTCPACFDEGMTEFRCAKKIDFKCIRLDLDVDDVNAALERALTESVECYYGEDVSPLRIYGHVLVGS